MTVILKKAIAVALTAGAALASVGAHALGTVDSGSSDLVIFIQDVESNGTTIRGTYALDTGISLDSILPTGSLVTGAKASTAISFNHAPILASSTLTTLLGGVQSGDSVIWSVEGGYYNDLGNSANTGDVSTAGAAKAVFSSSIGTANNTKISNLTPTAFVNLLNQYNSLSGSVSALAITLGAATETTAATWDATDQAKGGVLGNGVTPDVTTLGSGPLTLFAITGNNAVTGKVQSYVLGTVNVDAQGNVTFAGNAAPVPLPAAVWLLGSGLMGLFGVSRRRAAAAV
jgi:hypothetical protein